MHHDPFVQECKDALTLENLMQLSINRFKDKIYDHKGQNIWLYQYDHIILSIWGK